MDIESYMRAVRDRLGEVSDRRDASRSLRAERHAAALGPIHQELAAAAEQLQQRRRQLRQEKHDALHALIEPARRSRETASAQAARILAEAKQRGQQLREQARADNEQQRQRVADEHDQRLHSHTRELEDKIAELRCQETTARAELGDELDDTERQYSIEYNKIIAERLLTRKALANMGFSAPPRQNNRAGASNGKKKGR